MNSSDLSIPNSIDKERLAKTLSMQYRGLNVRSLIWDEKLRVVYSRKTKRISYVFLDNTHILSLRTSDGRYLVTFAGALKFRELGFKSSTIVVHQDAVPFVAEGKSLYCKHVIESDETIRPGSEVFLISDTGKLLATGLSIHPSYALKELDSGVAVKVKHHLSKFEKKEN